MMGTGGSGGGRIVVCVDCDSGYTNLDVTQIYTKLIELYTKVKVNFIIC